MSTTTTSSIEYDLDLAHFHLGVTRDHVAKIEQHISFFEEPNDTQQQIADLSIAVANLSGAILCILNEIEALKPDNDDDDHSLSYARHIEGN